MAPKRQFVLLNNWASLIQTIVGVFAVFIGGYWSWHTYKLDEGDLPHAEISQSVSQWKLSNSHRYVSAVFEIKNTGNTRLSITCGEMYIQQILPIPDASFVTNKLRPFYDNRAAQPLSIPWEVIQDQGITTDLSTDDESMGPGESDHIAVDFLIPENVKVAVVFGVFQKNNPGCKRNPDGRLRGPGMVSRMIYKMSDDTNGGG